MDETGAIVVGRKLFDFTQGWGGQHPLGCPVVVLTHNPPADWPHQQFHFVSTGIEGAVKKAVELADGKIVGVNGGEIANQCLAAGLLDEVWIDLVPVLLGGGTRLFPDVPGAPALLDLVSVLEATASGGTADSPHQVNYCFDCSASRARMISSTSVFGSG